jgi:uncharacterized membrane protein YuzA (DUF378 family)
MMKKGCSAHCVAWTLVMIGALNWGLVGLFDFNLVEAIFGGWPTLVRVIYVVVGVSALFMLMDSCCKKCAVK